MGIGIEQKNSTGNALKTYTAAFVFTALLCYVIFIVKGTSLIKFGTTNVDGLTQTYPAYVAIRHMFRDLFAGKGLSAWTWSLGLGGDTFEYFGSKLFNPLTYLIILFPDDKIDLGYTLATILRQYLTGLTFLLCMREVKLDVRQSVAGALSYAFSGWVFGTVLNQGSFSNAAVVLPLLVMGTEKIYKKKSPLLFILSVAFCLTTGVTWTYISGIVIVGYWFARYHDYHGGEGMAEFFRNFGQYAMYGICGIMIAFPFILSMLSSMGAATTDTGADNRTLAYALEKYLSIPEGLFRAVEVGAVSYSYICLSVICILLMPMIIMQLKKRKTVAWIAVVLSFAAIFPITSKVFNGFSYPAGRWYYVLTFFLTWACMECLNRDTLSSKKNRLIMSGWLAFLVVWVAAMYFIIGIGSKGALAAALCGGVCGAMMIACIAIYFDKCSNAKQRRIVQFAGGLILVGAIVCSANMKLLPGNYAGDYLRFGDAADRVAASSERVVDSLYEEDDDFYRTDMAYRCNRKLHSKLRVNSNLIYNNRSIYTYSSLLDSRVNRFCSVVGNNYGCFARLAMISNDNRPCLDYLLGVRYYLGNNRYEKNASDYGGPDFEKHADIDGVEVLGSRRSIGIGTSFTSYITESELMSMPQLVRDQIMMQTAVIPDDSADTVAGVKHADVSELEMAIDPLEIKTVAGKNTDIDQKNRTITVKGGKGHLTISPADADGCNIMLSFKGLTRAEKSWEDHLQYDKSKGYRNPVTASIKKASYRDRGAFMIVAKVGDIKKYCYFEKNSTRGFNDTESFNLNLGEYSAADGDIEVTLSDAGEYSYEDMVVYSVPMDVFDKNADKLEQARLDLTEWSGDSLSGIAENDKESVLFLSVPYNRGWTARVDGEKVETLDTDIAFTGIVLPAGKHSVELEYSHWGMKGALAISLAGAALLAIILIRRKKKA